MFVTHLHGDHCVGILGLLQTMTMKNRTETLEIFGPSGIDEFIAANIKILNFGLSFPILITVVKEGKIFENEKFLMYACKANHSVTAFSYLFEEKDKPGRFNVEKAKELGIPEGELWNKLQNGNEIIINEKTIRPDQVLGEKRSGKKIGISGDTTSDVPAITIKSHWPAKIMASCHISCGRDSPNQTTSGLSIFPHLHNGGISENSVIISSLKSQTEHLIFIILPCNSNTSELPAFW